jgi:hypothetical protein
MRIGISMTSNHPDAKDPRQGARWMIERAAAARRAGLDSLFVGDQHVSPTPYYQNTPMLGRLLAEWGDAPAGCLFLLPLWHPVLVAEQIGTLAAIARGPLHHVMRARLGRSPICRNGRQYQDASFGVRGSARHCPAPLGR